MLRSDTARMRINPGLLVLILALLFLLWLM
jgi:hypothetical protein